MVLPWTRRRLRLQTQRETEEQLAGVAEQFLQVGEIIGRLEAVATRFEAISTEVIGKMEARNGNGNGDGDGDGDG